MRLGQPVRKGKLRPEAGGTEGGEDGGDVARKDEQIEVLRPARDAGVALHGIGAADQEWQARAPERREVGDSAPSRRRSAIASGATDAGATDDGGREAGALGRRAREVLTAESWSRRYKIRKAWRIQAPPRRFPPAAPLKLAEIRLTRSPLPSRPAPGLA
jgi:hypothetical protein